MNSSDNRAVSALFRVFGGPEPSVSADTRAVADRRGMNAHETRVLAILVPVTVLVAIGEWLTRPPGLVLLAVPAAFLVLHILPFLFRAGSPKSQWFLWLSACVIWAFLRRHEQGVVSLLAYVWLGIAVMNVAAAGVLDWQTSMGWSGGRGLLWRSVLWVALHLGALAAGFILGWPWALACGAAIALAGIRAILDPSCQWLGPVVCLTDPSTVLITIDDGPDPQDTPVLLDLLDRHQAKAIFFMIGEKARAHPDLAREVVRRGHEIGNHTHTHPQASFWCAGPWRTHREISTCQQVIREVTGQTPRWFRAPVGHRNLFTHPVTTSLGLRVMAWNRRGYDAVEKDPAKVLARILPELSPGDIALLHESTPIAADVLRGVLEKAYPLTNLKEPVRQAEDAVAASTA